MKYKCNIDGFETDSYLTMTIHFEQHHWGQDLDFDLDDMADYIIKC